MRLSTEKGHRMPCISRTGEAWHRLDGSCGNDPGPPAFTSGARAPPSQGQRKSPHPDQSREGC